MSCLVLLCLLCVPRARPPVHKGTKSVQDPGTPLPLHFPDFAHMEEEEELEEFPPAADPAAFFLSLLASPPSAHAATGCRPGPIPSFDLVPLLPSCTCAPALCRASSYDWLSCCDCLGSTRERCCVIKDAFMYGYGVAVSGPPVLLFDALALVDSGVALLLACSLLGENLGLGSVQQKAAQVTDVPQAHHISMLQLQHALPEYISQDKVDLAMMADRTGVPHCFIADVIFENFLSVTVGEIQAEEWLLSAASDPVAEELGTQAAAASSNLRARFGEEEKMQKVKWSLPQKSKNEPHAVLLF